MGSASKVVSSGFDAIFARQKYKNDTKEVSIQMEEAKNQEAAARKEKELKYYSDLENKKNLLKKNLATQKAKFGSQLINTDSLSSQAVMKNIQDFALKEMQKDKTLHDLEKNKLQDELNISLSKSLLKKKRAKKSELENYTKNTLKAANSIAQSVVGL